MLSSLVNHTAGLDALAFGFIIPHYSSISIKTDMNGSVRLKTFLEIAMYIGSYLFGLH